MIGRLPGIMILGLGLGALLAVISCTTPISVNVDQRVTVVQQPQPTPLPAGCSPITLDATPTGAAGTVLLSVSGLPATGGTLLDGGSSLGPVSDGQSLALASGTHNLQVAAGACVSNVATVTVP